jgi:sarcosine oxidase
LADYDVIVVGLGAMGSASLYHLARRGLRVLGLEAFGPGHQLGSSHGESRIIRMAYHEHPNYVPLVKRAYELWADLERTSGEQLLTLTGGLMIGRPDSALVSGARASADQHKLPYEILDAAEVHRRYPALHPQADEVALWEVRSGLLRPERCIETHVRLAREAGAVARYDERVTDWSSDGSSVKLQTASATYRAGKVVFTCGARIASLLGEDVAPVTAERIPVFWMEPAEPALFALGRLPIYIWQPPDGGHFYGFPHVDWPGVKIARHHSGHECDPDTVDRTVTALDERRLRDTIRERVPALNTRVVSSLVCLYENSPDEHFLIDHIPRHPEAIYAGGFSGHGFKFAAVVGEIVADLVTTGRATPYADFLRADRLQKAGRTSSTNRRMSVVDGKPAKTI